MESTQPTLQLLIVDRHSHLFVQDMYHRVLQLCDSITWKMVCIDKIGEVKSICISGIWVCVNRIGQIFARKYFLFSESVWVASKIVNFASTTKITSPKQIVYASDDKIIAITNDGQLVQVVGNANTQISVLVNSSEMQKFSNFAYIEGQVVGILKNGKIAKASE